MRMILTIIATLVLMTAPGSGVSASDAVAAPDIDDAVDYSLFLSLEPECQDGLRAVFDVWDYAERGTTPIPADEVYAGFVTLSAACGGLSALPHADGLPRLLAPPGQEGSMRNMYVEGESVVGQPIGECGSRVEGCMGLIYLDESCDKVIDWQPEHTELWNAWIVRLAPLE